MDYIMIFKNFVEIDKNSSKIFLEIRVTWNSAWGLF